MRRIIVFVLSLFMAAATANPAAAQEKPAAPPSAQIAVPPAAKAEDVSSADAILAALYDVISGPAGQKRDWDRMRSLFVPGARLIPTRRDAQSGEVRLLLLDVEGYITRSAPLLEKNGFFEKEIARRSERFGNILHAFSTYESRHTAADPAPFARGINSIQLLFDGKRWWVVTIYWQGESPENPLPNEYLSSPKP
jgi:hypothetical protein